MDTKLPSGNKKRRYNNLTILPFSFACNLCVMLKMIWTKKQQPLFTQ